MIGPRAPEPPIARGAVASTLGTSLSRATGFLRLSALAYALGIAETRLTDTYNLANTTPNIIYELVLGGVLSSVLLRAYVEVRDKEGEEEAALFLTRVTNVGTALLAGITVLAVVGAPWLLRIYTFRAPAADRAAQQEVGTLLFRLFAPQILFYGLSTISTAALRARRRFGVFMFVPVLNNLIVAGAYLAFAAAVPRSARTLEEVPTGGVLLLGLGTTLGVVVLGLVPWLFLRRLGWRPVRGAGFKDPRFKRLAVLSAYTLGYVAINQAGLWVALVLANGVQGGVSAYQTAFVFFQLPHGLFAVSIATVLGTGLAERAVARDLETFSGRVVLGLRAIAFILLPATAGYIAIAPQVVRVMLEHGMATSASTELIAPVLRAFALGLFFFSSFHMLREAFQALGDTRTPMLINLGAFGVNVVVNLAAFFAFGDPRLKVTGLAMGHAASYLAASLAGVWLLRRATGRLELGQFGHTLAKALLASAATGLGAWALARAVERAVGSASLATQLLPIGAAVVGGLIIYAGMASLLRLKELQWIKRLVPRRAM